jgi:NAD(P)-dependent dehydrogenase (short-subunit alcohol dehydrogenase family)
LQREALLPKVRELFKGYTKAELVPILEKTGLPFAPIGKPEEISAMAVYLGSDESGFTTGAEFRVDGGSSI